MLLLSVTLLSLAASAVGGDSSVDNLLATSTNQFSAKMFSEVERSDPNRNVVVSGLSVMSPLAQLAHATVGQCHHELLNSIGMPNIDTATAVFLQLNKRLKSSKYIDFQMANKIYVAEGYELSPLFAAVSKHVFDSEVEHLNFINNVGSAKEINSWVEDKTKHRITNFVDPSALSEDTQALLINAIYFKGKWKYPFFKAVTNRKHFNTIENKVVTVAMMHAVNSYKYVSSGPLDAQIIEIPYSYESASMIIALPNKIGGISELERTLSNQSTLNDIYESMHERKIELHLPKFKIETTTNLRSILENMNVRRLFSPDKASLDNLIKDADNFYVSDAIQKALIEVNEEGAEATAANVFNFISRSGLEEEELTILNANRPFYFLLKMNSIVLFSGVVKTFD